jgi:murein DD-endopeptidase MepM/ murein hydrolase activator NlpD
VQDVSGPLDCHVSYFAPVTRRQPTGIFSQQVSIGEVTVSSPVPGAKVGTVFGRRGKHWKTCKVIKDKKGAFVSGMHTGVDFPAKVGTKVVAARAGVTAHVAFGKAFGSHQLVVRCPDGTQDFYAHMSERVADGLKVKAGDRLGAVGKEGNITGPHLHFERHIKHATAWSCAIVTDPSPSIGSPTSLAKPAPKSASATQVLLSGLRFGKKQATSVRLLQNALNAHKLAGVPALPLSGNYLKDTDNAVRTCQQRHGFGNDAVGKSNVGPKQAAHLFGTKVTIVDDR